VDAEMSKKTTKKQKRGKRDLTKAFWWLEDAEYLAEQIDSVATIMQTLAGQMQYYAGFNVQLGKHAKEMAGAAKIARDWADAIRTPPEKKVQKN
jgi:hypothetical protein